MILLKTQGSTTTATLGILVGLLVAKIYSPLLGYLLLGGSGLLLFMEIRKHTAMRTLFRNLGLYNKDEIYPMQKGKYLSQDRTTYHYSIPPGLGLEDFEKQKGRIQDYLGKRVIISCHCKNIILEVFKQ